MIRETLWALPLPHLLTLLSLALAAVLACGAGLLAAWFLRRRAVPVQYGLLLSALALTLAAPLLTQTARMTNLGRIEVSVAPVPSQPAAPQPALVETRPVVQSSPVVVAPPAVATRPAVRAESLSMLWRRHFSWRVLGTVLAVVWALGVVAGLARLLIGAILVWRLKRSSQPSVSARVLDSATNAARLLGLRDAPEIRVSSLTASPMVMGIARPAILLPSGMEERLDDAHLAAALLHETAHIAHRDTLIGLFQRVAATLFWWCPLVHLVNRRLDDLREDICDNYVIRAQGDGLCLAQVLVHVAERTQDWARMRWIGAMAMTEPTGKGFEGRVRRLLQKERSTVTRMNLAAVCATMAFAALLGGAILATTVRAVEGETTAERTIQHGELVDGGRARIVTQSLRTIFSTDGELWKMVEEVAPIVAVAEPNTLDVRELVPILRQAATRRSSVMAMANPWILILGPALNSDDRAAVTSFEQKGAVLRLTVDYTSALVRRGVPERSITWRPLIIAPVPHTVVAGQYRIETTWRCIDRPAEGVKLPEPLVLNTELALVLASAESTPRPRKSTPLTETVGQESWGVATNGLQTRLSAEKDRVKAGEPIRLKLELRNVGTENLSYDSQQVDVNDPLIVRGPKGEEIPFVAGRVSTLGGGHSIKPGETVVLFDGLDAAGQYLLTAPGVHTFQFRGIGEEGFAFRGKGEPSIPPSNEVHVELTGEPTATMKREAALLKSTPGGWHFARGAGGDAKVTPAGRQEGRGCEHVWTTVAKPWQTVHLWITEKPTAGVAGAAEESADLGPTSAGHAYVWASVGAWEAWQNLKTDIRAALGGVEDWFDQQIRSGRVVEGKPLALGGGLTLSVFCQAQAAPPTPEKATPLIVGVRVTNTGKKDVEFQPASLRLMLKWGDGPMQDVGINRNGLPGRQPPLVLKPGEKWTWTVANAQLNYGGQPVYLSFMGTGYLPSEVLERELKGNADRIAFAAQYQAGKAMSQPCEPVVCRLTETEETKKGAAPAIPAADPPVRVTGAADARREAIARVVWYFDQEFVKPEAQRNPLLKQFLGDRTIADLFVHRAELDQKHYPLCWRVWLGRPADQIEHWDLNADLDLKYQRVSGWRQGGQDPVGDVKALMNVPTAEVRKWSEYAAVVAQQKARQTRLDAIWPRTEAEAARILKAVRPELAENVAGMSKFDYYFPDWVQRQMRGPKRENLCEFQFALDAKDQPRLRLMHQWNYESKEKLPAIDDAKAWEKVASEYLANVFGRAPTWKLEVYSPKNLPPDYRNRKDDSIRSPFLRFVWTEQRDGQAADARQVMTFEVHEQGPNRYWIWCTDTSATGPAPTGGPPQATQSATKPAAVDPKTASLADALTDWIALLEKDDSKTATARWAMDATVGGKMTAEWKGLRECHKQHDYRRWIENSSDEPTTGLIPGGARRIGKDTTFRVGGHGFGHLHIMWEKTHSGWRIVSILECM